MKTFASVWVCVSVLGGCLTLSGCSTSFAPQGSGTEASSVGKIQGLVHGGQQPIVGARVYVYEATNLGYGGPGISDSGNTASVSLLTSATGNAADGSGNFYVVTDSGGNFVVTGDYSCDANRVVYMYATGGDAGSGPNSDIGLLAVLGVCPSSGADMSSVTPYVFMDEVTTVAAAYALSGFATDATDIGSASGSSNSDSLALQGIQNAAANAANIVNVATGSAYTTTPGSVGGNVGTVPYQKINTLANILASCINSSGSASAACTTLFSNAMSGGSSGATATDTATVAINIAHNAGVNVSTLYGLQTGTGVPFPSDLSSAPNDFTLPVIYSGGGLRNPYALAVDGSGNVWVSNYTGNSLSEFSPLGVAQSPFASGFTGGGISLPTGIAIDSSNNVWVKNAGANVISEFDSTGQQVSSTGYTPTNFTSGSGTNGIAFDASGNLWVTAISGGNPVIMEAYASGGSIGTLEAGPYTGGGMTSTGGQMLAVDPNGMIWVTNDNGTISQFNTAGVSQFGGTGATISGMSDADWVTFDSAGDLAWVVDATSSEIAELNESNGATVTSSTGSPGGVGHAYTVQMDAAGSIWTANHTGNSISQLTISGTTISGSSPSTGYVNPDTSTTPNASPLIASMQLDGSGDVWAADSNNYVIQWIGLAAPQSTPVNPTTYATRP